MSARFEELGWQQTPMGVISLRRRFDPSVRADIYEVKLDDEKLAGFRARRCDRCVALRAKCGDAVRLPTGREPSR